MVEPIRTNRDLYLAIKDLPDKFAGTSRTLEQFLLCLLKLAEQYKSREFLTVGEFFELIESSFTQPHPKFVESWRKTYDALPAEDEGYRGWRAGVARQIVDLRELDESGGMHGEFAWAGVTSPRGSTWYNFHPFTYLECAMAGSFGGWDPDVDQGRIPLSSHPKPDGVELIPDITWADFAGFLYCGQIYE